VCCFSVLFVVYTCTSIFICGSSCLRSAGYFKTGTSISLQPIRRVFHSTAIQPSSRVRISSFKVIIIIRLFTPSRRHPDPIPGHRELSIGIGARPLQCGLSRPEMTMSSQEVTLELLLGDGSNYKSWSVSIYNAFMHIDPHLRQIFIRSIFPSNISKNPSNAELKCLSLNHHACNILVDSLSSGAYFSIMSSDSDLFVDAHDIWTRIKIKYSESNCTTSTPYVACCTNLSKGEEKRWQPNDESTSPTGLSSTSYKCLIANNDSGDKSDDEEEYEDDSEDESSSPQGTFSYIASTDNNDRENETGDVEEEEIRQFYTHLNKEDKVLLVKLLRRNKVRCFSG
jgi:hypothetical protein